MKNIIRNISLKSKLMLLLVIPIAGMIYFSQMEIRNALNIRTESLAIVRLAQFSIKASALVHELQKERGTSAGYLGSNGTKFAQQLPARYQETDVRISDLKNFLNTFNSDAYGKQFAQKLAQTMTFLEKISKIRLAVTDLNMSLAQTLRYYTTLNARYLSLAGDLSQLSENGEIVLLATGYENFLQSKERAGIERAVLANTFAADAFGNGLYDKFMGLVTTQNVYMDVFHTLANTEQEDFYQQTLKGEFIDATEDMRKIAQRNAQSGGFNVDPSYWFKMQTGKINLLKKVEDKLSTDLIIKAETLSGQADQALFVAATVSIIGILLTTLLSFIFIRDILQQLGCDPRDLHNFVEAIASGDFHKQPLPAKKPATGVYASAQQMQKNLRDQIEQERRLAAETNRIKQALDNVSSNVIVADNDLKIIYQNHAIKNMFTEIEESLRQEIPSFESQHIIGANLATFKLQLEDDQHESLNALTDSQRINRVIGGRHLQLTANPVITDDGTRLGTVVEWNDRTNEVRIEQEIESIVTNVKLGELGHRIELTDKTGFFAILSENINELAAIIETVFAAVNRSMQSVAQGNLTNRISGNYQGIYQQCQNNINASIDRLSEIVNQINEASDYIFNSSREIATGNNNLSQRAEQQAASLEETAASMDQLTSTVKNNADNAQLANQLATNARNLAEQGGEVVNSAINAMQDINDSSHRMVNIINVIDEIAFQTNLLALNASVEAARAGEHGRGFAVVATEVRNLAQRSANAAKESKELIKSSVDNVNSGTEYVKKTVQSLQEIVISVKKVSDVVNEISAASSEQSQGIVQVNRAVTQLDEITQQNAALAEQASAASLSMSKEATKMSEHLAFFQLNSADSHSAMDRETQIHLQAS